MKNGNVRLTIPAKAEYLDIVRMTLYGIASKQGFGIEQIEDMKVAVTEACTNAIVHGYRLVDSGMIELIFHWDDDYIHIQIKDEGKSFDYVHSEDNHSILQHKPLHEAPIGGLGIFMMQALMDKVEVISDGGTTVILTKQIVRNGEIV